MTATLALHSSQVMPRPQNDVGVLCEPGTCRGYIVMTTLHCSGESEGEVCCNALPLLCAQLHCCCPAGCCGCAPRGGTWCGTAQHSRSHEQQGMCFCTLRHVSKHALCKLSQQQDVAVHPYSNLYASVMLLTYRCYSFQQCHLMHHLPVQRNTIYWFLVALQVGGTAP